MKFYRILILIFIGLFSISAVAGDYEKGRQRPLHYERLPQPIALSGACRKIKIIEWRPTVGHSKSTRLTKRAVNIVNSTCNAAALSFYSFIDSKGKYTVSKEIRERNFETSLSFMPANMNRGGGAPRNLNDFKYRFVDRASYGPVWGWFQRSTDWAYIRNDVLNDDNKTFRKKFVIVTAHELFHAMSYASGVFHQHKPASDRDDIEEEMARQFTEYLGLGK